MPSQQTVNEAGAHEKSSLPPCSAAGGGSRCLVRPITETCPPSSEGRKAPVTRGGSRAGELSKVGGMRDGKSTSALLLSWEIGSYACSQCVFVVCSPADSLFFPLQTCVCTPNTSSPASFGWQSTALTAGLSCGSRTCPQTLGSNPDPAGSSQGSRYPEHPFQLHLVNGRERSRERLEWSLPIRVATSPGSRLLLQRCILPGDSPAGAPPVFGRWQLKCRGIERSPREGDWELGKDAGPQPQPCWAQRAALVSWCLG